MKHLGSGEYYLMMNYEDHHQQHHSSNNDNNNATMIGNDSLSIDCRDDTNTKRLSFACHGYYIGGNLWTRMSGTEEQLGQEKEELSVSSGPQLNVESDMCNRDESSLVIGVIPSKIVQRDINNTDNKFTIVTAQYNNNHESVISSPDSSCPIKQEKLKRRFISSLGTFLIYLIQVLD